jgi:phosphoribosyl-ATP pyrophosphohydrolase/phosphoribosyl-AMP cyclohydrolase
VKLTDIAQVDLDKNGGLVPAIVQDVDSGAVLMLGYMNGEALRATLDRKRVVFFSRSRQRLWEKGETSGHALDLIDAYIDCDNDTLLITARPRGPACHTGSMTCFGDEPVTRAETVAFLGTLERIIEHRLTQQPEGSYTAKLFAQGKNRIAQKVGEEGVELALAGVGETDDKVIGEAADLLFHMLVLLKSRKIPLEQVIAELERRDAGKTVPK